MDVFGLLFVNADSERHLNLRRHQGGPLDIYLRCAANSARSFNRSGDNFSLLTNNCDYLQQRGRALDIALPPITELSFKREIPRGLDFASAHRKLEVFEAFGTGQFGPRPVLVDLDTELLRPLPPSLHEPGTIHALDMTALMAAEFGDRLPASLTAILGGAPRLSRWFGGEFICADPEHFAAVADIANACWSRYLAQAKGAIHTSDEALTSAALSKLASEGQQLVDAGNEGVVSRYWSSRTSLPMPPFRQAARAALLHLPADKEFLADRAGCNPNPADFVRDYRRAVSRKLISRAVLNGVERTARRGVRLYAPRW